MVRTVGVDPGEHAVKVVEIDGSYRKTRLVRVQTALVDDPAQRVEVAATTTRAALDDGMKGEVFLGHPCHKAVLRTIELPFKGHEAIRKVVKAEIEGEIHSHAVDDMVVDFHEVGAGAEGGTRVLVAAVPKGDLRTQLTACTAQSIEPESVDLDTMALWRAADWAGVFEPTADAPEGAPPQVTAIVDLGARSVKVLLIEGDQLVEMRAPRLGDAAIVDEVARRNGLSYAVARDVVRQCLDSGSDQRIEVEEALPAATGEGAAPAPVKHRVVTITHAEIDSAMASFRQRLQRELVRGLTSTTRGSAVRALWITGGASRLPGIRETLRDVFGVEPQDLDLLGHLQHDLTPEVAAEVGPTIAVAIGLALTRLGGPSGFDLRQEDLAFTRGFERVKFPLAIACMVGLLALFVHTSMRSTQLKNLEFQIGRTYVDSANPKAPKQFHGMLNSVFAGKWFENPTNFRWEQTKGKDYLYKDLIAELDALPVEKRIPLVRDKLKAVVLQKQKETGIYEDVNVESGLAVLVRFAQMMKGAEPELGRYLLTKIFLEMKAPRRYLEFVVAFRGEGARADDFRTRLGALERAIDAECGKPDSPFLPPESKAGRSREDLFKADPSVKGAYYTIKLGVKDTFATFGPSAGD